MGIIIRIGIGLARQGQKAGGILIKQVAPPVITIDDDGVITMATATEEATIYYTADSSTPTTDSAAYTAPFKLIWSALAGIKARAFRDGYKPSSVTVSESYTRYYGIYTAEEVEEKVNVSSEAIDDWVA